jgi:hypothetical protein
MRIHQDAGVVNLAWISATSVEIRRPASSLSTASRLILAFVLRRYFRMDFGKQLSAMRHLLSRRSGVSSLAIPASPG